MTSRRFDPAPVGVGTGLQGMADLEAVGGRLEIESSGEGTTVTGWVPVGIHP